MEQIKILTTTKPLSEKDKELLSNKTKAILEYESKLIDSVLQSKSYKDELILTKRLAYHRGQCQSQVLFNAYISCKFHNAYKDTLDQEDISRIEMFINCDFRQENLPETLDLDLKSEFLKGSTERLVDILNNLNIQYTISEN